MDNFIDNLVQIAVDSVDPIDLPIESEQRTTEIELRKYIASYVSMINLEDTSIDTTRYCKKMFSSRFKQNINLLLLC